MLLVVQHGRNGQLQQGLRCCCSAQQRCWFALMHMRSLVGRLQRVACHHCLHWRCCLMKHHCLMKQLSHLVQLQQLCGSQVVTARRAGWQSQLADGRCWSALPAQQARRSRHRQQAPHSMLGRWNIIVIALPHISKHSTRKQKSNVHELQHAVAVAACIQQPWDASICWLL